MIKRIIFDIDGTLIKGVNFEPYITSALQKYGIEDLKKTKQFLSSIKEYEHTHNCYDRDLYLNFFSQKLEINLDRKFLTIFFGELKNAIPTNSNKIKAMLLSLNEYELVILSNYFEESQRKRLTNMGINDFFSEYYGEKIIKPNKLAYTLAQGNNKEEECLIVGDDINLDINIPKSLGFKTLYVNENDGIKTVEKISPKLIRNLK